ncbi:MAG: twin-arginine translocation signal domain-containing protein [Planctomycetaceae bacterium]|nr:twin-arginine translocation signal domain-containing protein [Planctomycetaceae bacterium]
MTNRRNFLKHMALVGAAATTPISFALGQSEPLQMPNIEYPDGAFSVSHVEVRRPTIPPRKITIPDVGEYKVLKGDFHIHSIFSDGVAMPRDRVLEAVDNGLDVISITDHIEYRPFFGGNHISYGGNRNNVRLLDKDDDHNIAYDLAKPEADRQNLILVRGTEITKRTMPPGDLNAIFLEDANPIAVAVDDWKKMLAIASDQGGFVFWVHPGAIMPGNGGLLPGEPMSFTNEHEDVYKKGHLHGVEIFNGSTYYPIVSQWCEERNLAMLATSDVHATEWNTLGHQNPLRPITLILAKERTHDSVRDAFFARRTIGFAAGMVFGCREWLKKLFTACVTMTARPGLLELTYKSDIPCFVQAGGTVRELPTQGQLSIYQSVGVRKLTVHNWLVGMNQPLEIDLG